MAALNRFTSIGSLGHTAVPLDIIFYYELTTYNMRELNKCCILVAFDLISTCADLNKKCGLIFLGRVRVTSILGV